MGGPASSHAPRPIQILTPVSLWLRYPLPRPLSGASQEAERSGEACVITCPQDSAQKYCKGLRDHGLTCSCLLDSGA